MSEQVAFNPLQILAQPGPLKEKPQQLKENWDRWVVTKAPWVEGLSSGAFGAFQGAFLGTLMGSMTKMQGDVGGASEFITLF